MAISTHMATMEMGKLNPEECTTMTICGQYRQEIMETKNLSYILCLLDGNKCDRLWENQLLFVSYCCQPIE